MPSGSIPLALQNLFSELQSSDNTVTSKEFMEAFGWITYNSFPQHDVKEFFRTLFEKLEEKMKVRQYSAIILSRQCSAIILSILRGIVDIISHLLLLSYSLEVI